MDPLSEHVNPVKTASAKIDAADEPVLTASAPTMVAIQREFEFFTVGVLHAAIPGLNRDLFRDFLRTVASPSLGVAGVFFGARVFNGLGTRTVCEKEVDFDRMVYAVHKTVWKDCLEFIGGAVFIDPTTGESYRTVVYTIPRVDSDALRKMRIVTSLPAVPLTVFAVNGPRQFSYLTVPDYPALPTFKTGPAKTAVELAAMETV